MGHLYIWSTAKFFFNENGFFFYLDSFWCPYAILLSLLSLKREPVSTEEGSRCQGTWFPEPSGYRPVSGSILVVGFQHKLSILKKKKARRETSSYTRVHGPGVSFYSSNLNTNLLIGCCYPVGTNYHWLHDHSRDPVTRLSLGHLYFTACLYLWSHSHLGMGW